MSNDDGLDLSPSEAGSLGSVFIVGFMLAAPIYAYLAQFFHPMWLIISGMGIWCGATILSAFSVNFWMLFIARVISGIGEASMAALAIPYVSDAAPEGKKTLWIAIFWSSASVGGALGLVLGYDIAEAIGGWHFPFLIEAIIVGIILLIGAFSYKDPIEVRKTQDVALLTASELETENPTQEKLTDSLWKQLKTILSNKLFVLLVMGNAAQTFTAGGLAFWIIEFVINYYGINPYVANSVMGAIITVAGVVSTVVGGVITDKILEPYVQQRNENIITEDKLTWFKWEYATKVTFWFQLVGFIFFVGVGLWDNFIAFLVLISLADLFTFVTIGVMYQAFIWSCEEHLRNQVSAVANFMTHCFGDVASPYVIGVLVQYVGYYFAINFLTFWLIWALLFWGMAVILVQTHGASFKESLRVACSKNPREKLSK